MPLFLRLSPWHIAEGENLYSMFKVNLKFNYMESAIVYLEQLDFTCSAD